MSEFSIYISNSSITISWHVGNLYRKHLYNDGKCHIYTYILQQANKNGFVLIDYDAVQCEIKEWIRKIPLKFIYWNKNYLLDSSNQRQQEQHDRIYWISVYLANPKWPTKGDDDDVDGSAIKIYWMHVFSLPFGIRVFVQWTGLKILQRNTQRIGVVFLLCE